jgi:hypothetical protein
MVERISDRTNPTFGADVQPIGFQPASYQVGAEINQLKNPKTTLPQVSWEQDWEAAGTTPPLYAPTSPTGESQRNQSEGNRSRPKEGESQPPSPAEQAATERNTATVNNLFPGKQDQELRDAAYRYLMNKECMPGYPNMTEQDMSILKKNGALDKLDKLIEQDRKQGLFDSGPCVSS